MPSDSVSSCVCFFFFFSLGRMRVCVDVGVLLSLTVISAEDGGSDRRVTVCACAPLP